MELTGAAGNHRRRLLVVLGLTGSYLIAEVIGGIITGSLALIADAGHMLTDVFGLALALFAIWFAGRPASPERTYGYYRAEILAALANALVLFGIAGYILYEAWRRFQAPPEVESGPMLVVATIGLIVNVAGALLLRGAASESLNMQGAFLEVISDLLGSLGVILAAVIMALTGWYYADPIISVIIGLFIVPRTWTLVREAVGVLLEGTPSRINLAEVRAAMAAVPGVLAIHDLHAWSITSGMDALSAHVVTDEVADRDGVLAALNTLLADRLQIKHTTLQIESPSEAEAPRHV